MAEPTVRAALDAAASEICESAALGGAPCTNCRFMARDIVLRFLAEIPAVRPILPIELRVQVQIQGADA